MMGLLRNWWKNRRTVIDTIRLGSDFRQRENDEEQRQLIVVRQQLFEAKQRLDQVIERHKRPHHDS